MARRRRTWTKRTRRRLYSRCSKCRRRKSSRPRRCTQSRWRCPRACTRPWHTRAQQLRLFGNPDSKRHPWPLRTWSPSDSSIWARRFPPLLKPKIKSGRAETEAERRMRFSRLGRVGRSRRISFGLSNSAHTSRSSNGENGIPPEEIRQETEAEVTTSISTFSFTSAVRFPTPIPFSSPSTSGKFR